MSEWPRHLDALFPETSSSTASSPVAPSLSPEGTNGVNQRFPDLARLVFSKSPQGIQQGRRQTVNSNLGLAVLAIHDLLGVRIFFSTYIQYIIGADALFRPSLRRQQLRELLHGLSRARKGWTIIMRDTYPLYSPYPSPLCFSSPSMRPVGIVGSLSHIFFL